MLRAIIVLLICYMPVFSQEQEALILYTGAEKTTDLEEKQSKFNQSLNLWLEANVHHPNNAKLLYNVGNVYFQLQAYGQAAWYYQQSLFYAPLYSYARHNLHETWNVAGAYHQQAYSLFDYLSFSYWLAPYQKAWLTVILYILIVGFSVYRIFKRNMHNIHMFTVTLIILVCTLLILNLDMFAPKKAVLLSSAPLRQDKGHQYQTVTPQNLPAASCLLVKDRTDNEWVYVSTANNQQGYIEAKYLGLIP